MADPVNPQGTQSNASQGGGMPPPPQKGGSAGQGAAAGQGAGAVSGKDLSGIMEENVDISSLVANAGNQQQQQQFMSSVKIPPHPNTKFNEQEFLQLLSGSISLTINEKRKIIEAIPQLSQFQIDELIKIFREEKGKFVELEKKHADEIKDLEQKHAQSWQDLEAKSQEDQKKKEEQDKADALRKQLGL
ncbi:hypothetical protein HZA43_01375 [Candidatus Peregrinibacteria bacterium]|nr:hypothetical protein [Candidatus Peregrinibacteria bacterium]